jgi:nonsense-mediated mRNA decay protein 3
VVIIKKHYEGRKNRARRRVFKLKTLNKEKEDKILRKHEIAKEEADKEHFMQEIEEDPELRSRLALFKADVNPNEGKSMQEDNGSDEEDGFPEIPMDELLDDIANLSMRTAAPAEEPQQQQEGPPAEE